MESHREISLTILGIIAVVAIVGGLLLFTNHLSLPTVQTEGKAIGDASPPQAVNCTDDDPAQNILTRGSIFITMPGGTPNFPISDDCYAPNPAATPAGSITTISSCSGQGCGVLQFMCTGSQFPLYDSQRSFCPNGCANGACLSTPACTPKTEVCNGIDDDCDGNVDIPLILPRCGTSQCARSASCVNGQSSCTPGTPQTEVCNGQDDDCDRQVDEDLGTKTCGVGICANTVQACENGKAPVCFPKIGERNEVCTNLLDDNCNGQVDEGCPPLPDLTAQANFVSVNGRTTISTLGVGQTALVHLIVKNSGGPARASLVRSQVDVVSGSTTVRPFSLNRAIRIPAGGQEDLFAGESTVFPNPGTFCLRGNVDTSSVVLETNELNNGFTPQGCITVR